MAKCECINCGNKFDIISISNDELGWHTTCMECDSDFDIGIKDYIGDILKNHIGHNIECIVCDVDNIIIRCKDCGIDLISDYLYSNSNQKLWNHIGHNIECVAYGDINNPSDICIECKDCNEILVSTETYDEEEDKEDTSIMAKDLIGKKCVKEYKIQLFRSPCGYYLGTIDKDGRPNCRISNGYAKTLKLAEIELMGDRVCEDNLFCNGGRGCFVKQ